MLRAVALVSVFYDLGVGLALIFLRPQMQTWFAVAAPQPPIHADLNGLFLIAVAVGYLLPFKWPEKYRAYLWIFGVFLKAAGAAAFIIDYCYRGAPASFLLFAASDGLLAALTLLVLLLAPGGSYNARLRRNQR